jgi:hypothetical protein
MCNKIHHVEHVTFEPTDVSSLFLIIFILPIKYVILKFESFLMIMKHTDKHFHVRTNKNEEKKWKTFFFFNNQQLYFPSSKSHYVLQNGKQMKIIPGWFEQVILATCSCKEDEIFISFKWDVINTVIIWNLIMKVYFQKLIIQIAKLTHCIVYWPFLVFWPTESQVKQR